MEIMTPPQCSHCLSLKQPKLCNITTFDGEQRWAVIWICEVDNCVREAE